MNQTYFSYIGNTVDVISVNDETTKSTLTPAIYAVSHDPMRGYYLTYVDAIFEVPEKLFGSVQSRVDKVIHTYDTRTNSTGVLMTGNKGTGKTLLASLVANQFIERKSPVIVVNDCFVGTNFLEFIDTIGQCVIMFDEFAKVYGEKQQFLLTLLDGVYSSKRLVMFTENNARDIDQFFLNRTGRVFYHFRYSRLEDAAIIEYCQYHNVDKEKTEELITAAHNVRDFSMDMLVAIVEEFLRYGGDIDTLLSDMNIERSGAGIGWKPEFVFDVSDLKEAFIENGTTFNDNHRYYELRVENSAFKPVSPEVVANFKSVDDVIRRFTHPALEHMSISNSPDQSITDMVEATLQRVGAAINDDDYDDDDDDDKYDYYQWSQSEQIYDNGIYGVFHDKQRNTFLVMSRNINLLF